MIAAALAWARRGVPVLPLWSTEGPRCACPDPDCKHPGKHPIPSLAPHGKDSATLNERQIGEWWRREPRANLGGLVPGGYVVLDVDGPDGEAALLAWARDHGPLPRTLTIRTGRERGTHLWFNTGGRIYRQRSPLPHVDIRASGRGYVVLPPSVHASGRTYQIVRDLPIALVTDALDELLRGPAEGRKPSPPPPPPEALDEAQRRVLGMLRAACQRIEAAGPGERHRTLYREAFTLGGYLDACGATVDQVAPSLIAAGETAGADDPARHVLHALEAGRERPRALPPNSPTYRGGAHAA